VAGELLSEWTARPESRLEDRAVDVPFLREFTPRDLAKVEIRIKYHGYLRREEARIRRFRDLESVRIPERLDVSTIHGISSEGREKLVRIRPATVGQAARISGVSPADVGVLLVALQRAG
jgi:tRNA uridine 5-carboxymethylaminomethyl modification enzyme